MCMYMHTILYILLRTQLHLTHARLQSHHTTNQTRNTMHNKNTGIKLKASVGLPDSDFKLGMHDWL